MAFKLELDRNALDETLGIEAEVIEYDNDLEDPMDDDLYLKILDKAVELAEEVDWCTPVCKEEYEELMSAWNYFTRAIVTKAAEEVLNQ